MRLGPCAGCAARRPRPQFGYEHDPQRSVPGPRSVRSGCGGSFSCSAFGFDAGGFDILRNSRQIYPDNDGRMTSATNTIASGTAMLRMMAARSMVSVSRTIVCTKNVSSRVRYKIPRALASGAIRWLSASGNWGKR